ncbi:hypothetical protein FZC74_06240 [Sutcliffiella horikoshii]|uniref:Uncharacterized protein n=1 Tax=Sutcliffiella horikoshii TaxID=79883 RepID=A0AA95B6S7_9BACI|nr:hypothetical protein FZC74_06240 [Sutcliffiella horikoshii]
MRPLKRCEEAHGPPAGKRSAWNGNQRYYILSLLKKDAKRVLTLLRVLRLTSFLCFVKVASALQSHS